MKHSTLDLLACPGCRGELNLDADELDTHQAGSLNCPACNRTFSIVDGIPHFIELEELNGQNRRFARAYDWMAWGYRAFSRIAFAYIGMDEETGRREITDRLEPQGGKVLEVSIGPGVNLPYLIGRKDVGEVYGLDISIGQLNRCRKYVTRKGWSVDLFLGNGEHLPFKDGSFEGVFHVGGINFFCDKQAAIEEMIRVAKPGARVLIADETETGVRAYEKFIPGFKESFGGNRDVIEAPMDLIPPEMLETHIFDAWKGWFYCIEFRKP